MWEENNIKELRRSIIVICGLIIIVWIIQNMPSNSFGFGISSKDVKKVSVKEYTCNQQAEIDDTTMTLKRINIDKDGDIHVQYRAVFDLTGWSFRFSSFNLYDDKGNTYNRSTSSSRNTFWGQEALVTYQGPIKEDANMLMLEYDEYNRIINFDVNLKKDGN